MAKAKPNKDSQRKKPIKRRLSVGLLFGAGLAAWLMPEYRFWLVGLIGIFVAGWLFYRLRQYRIPGSITEVDAMNGREFERFLVKLFQRLGYKTRHVGGSGDFGADLIVEKDQIKVAIQAKNYDTSRVGNDAVQQAIAGAAYYDCDVAMVVTNSTFTKAAKQQAKGSNLPVTLWDRTILDTAIKSKR